MTTQDWVWAIDENGKPTKCKAKPENRGKRNCKHRFHAQPGESQQEFFKKFMYDPELVQEGEYTTEDDRDWYTLDMFPSYDEMISKNICHLHKKYESYSELVQRVIDIPYMGQEYFPGTNITVTDEPDPNDPYQQLITLHFEKDGETVDQTFPLPKTDEMDRLYIDGSYYRCIPTFHDNNAGIDVNGHRTLIFKDDRGRMLLKVQQDHQCRMLVTESTGKQTWETVDFEQLKNAMDGKENILTQEQLAVLNSLSDEAKERYAKEGMDGLLALPQDSSNDITYRPCSTLGDRMAFSISKSLRSASSLYLKRIKSGAPQTYDLGEIDVIVKKDLVGGSYTQLSEDINPIAAISQAQRVSYIGPGGWSKDNVPAQLRFPHESHYGLVDSNDVALGGKVGTSVALKGYVGKDGLIKKSESNPLSGSDFIPYLKNSDPNRSAMAINQMKQAVPIVGGEDPKTSTRGWDAIKGSKIGVNLTVAYLPEEGVFEDAVVISESAAKRMTTVLPKRYRAAGKSDVEIGAKVHKGDRINGIEVKYDGIVTGNDEYGFTVDTTFPMTVGDKIAGRHGNKGVVSRILPDDQMPKVDGKNADLIMSPIGVAGRSNLGQVYEVNDGELNKKRRIDYKGHTVEGTGGNQFIMRLNLIAEKKLLHNSNKRNSSNEFPTRFGEMENLILTSDEDRLKVLDYIKHQEYNYGELKLKNLLKAVGVQLSPADKE